ncbi:MAG: hypothetical protein DRJ05_14325 [Bacteroidetes bacterium]|nr:MAG: hypothetical protein DRJ05_14325 [Bacteroidota bacterium]
MGNRRLRENLKTHNNVFDKCFKEESRKVFYVVDKKKGKSEIEYAVSDNEPALEIVNENPPIGFLSFDNCYAEHAKGYSGKRCDCVLFSSKELLFVELKLDVGNSRIARNLKEGRDQLSNTITYFYDYFKDDFNSFFCNAIVVLPKQPYPKKSARLANLKKKFFLDNFGVEYLENTEFTFNK